MWEQRVVLEWRRPHLRRFECAAARNEEHHLGRWHKDDDVRPLAETHPEVCLPAAVSLSDRAVGEGIRRVSDCFTSSTGTRLCSVLLAPALTSMVSCSAVAPRRNHTWTSALGDGINQWPMILGTSGDYLRRTQFIYNVDMTMSAIR